MKFIKRSKKVLLLIVLFTFIFLALIKAFAVPLTDSIYNTPNVKASWSEKTQEEGKELWNLTPSGLAYNGTFITGKPNQMFPFIWKPYLEKRAGKDVIEQVKQMEGKYIYCVASHTQNYKLEFGTQAYFERMYNTEYLPNFAPEPFNFLMLSMACYYPGSKELSKADQDPAGTPYYLVSQSIAWMATESAFRKDEPFSAALQKFRDSDIYDIIVNVDFKDQAAHMISRATVPDT